MPKLKGIVYCDWCWDDITQDMIDTQTEDHILCVECSSSPKWDLVARSELVQEFKCRCAFCGDLLKFKYLYPEVRMTYIVAHSKGGTDRYDNTVPTCVACCARKCNRPISWMRNRMGGLWFESQHELARLHPGTSPERQLRNLTIKKAVNVARLTQQLITAVDNSRLASLIHGVDSQEATECERQQNYIYQVTKDAMLEDISAQL